MSLQEKFEYLIKTLPHLPLPPKCLNLSDLHAAAGDDHDPLKSSGNEKLLIDTLRDHRDRGYALLGSEFYDLWRGFDAIAIEKAHPNLVSAICSYGELCWVLGNHEKDGLDLPEIDRPVAYVFEGFGKKIFLDHGWLYDWPNCEGWKIGRFAVRAADKLGIDPETSPHPSNPNRHLAVKQMRQELADANPGWDFLYGHTHAFKDVGNNHNSGAGYESPLKGFLIEEGNIIPFERR